jgi:hypothetical protein
MAALARPAVKRRSALGAWLPARLPRPLAPRCVGVQFNRSETECQAIRDTSAFQPPARYPAAASSRPAPRPPPPRRRSRRHNAGRPPCPAAARRCPAPTAKPHSVARRRPRPRSPIPRLVCKSSRRGLTLLQVSSVSSPLLATAARLVCKSTRAARTHLQASRILRAGRRAHHPPTAGSRRPVSPGPASAPPARPGRGRPAPLSRRRAFTRPCRCRIRCAVAADGRDRFGSRRFSRSISFFGPQVGRSPFSRDSACTTSADAAAGLRCGRRDRSSSAP